MHKTIGPKRGGASVANGSTTNGSTKVAPIMAVDAQLHSAAVAVQLIRLDIAGEVDTYLQERDVYRLDLCLNSRASESRLCFTDYWPSHRFEPPGKLFLLPPGEIVRVRSGASRQHLLLCRLKASSVQHLFSKDVACTRPRIEASRDVSSISIKNLLMRLGREARSPGFASEIFAEAIGVQIAVELERYYLATADQAGCGGLAAWRLRLIDDRLHATDIPPTLSELATLCNLSVRQLSRSFRVSRGVSIGTYVAEIRLDTAKRLLANGESIKAVAFAVGFTSLSSFSHAFRMSTGLPPREYQRGGVDSRADACEQKYL